MKINWVALLLAFLLGLYDGCTHGAFVGFVVGAYFIFVLISNKLFTKNESDKDKVNNSTISRDD